MLETLLLLSPGVSAPISVGSVGAIPNPQFPNPPAAPNPLVAALLITPDAPGVGVAPNPVIEGRIAGRGVVARVGACGLGARGALLKPWAKAAACPSGTGAGLKLGARAVTTAAGASGFLGGRRSL